VGRIAVNDWNGLIDCMCALETLPETVIEDMLMAGADVIIDSQKKKIRQMGLINTGQLQQSITKSKKLQRDGMTKYVDVYPQGERKPYKRTAKEKQKAASRRRYKKNKYPQKQTGSKGMPKNNEVAFVHEFGAPRRNIPALNWMQKADKEGTDEAARQAGIVYDKFLRSNKL